MFREIRYELNSVEINQNKNVGITNLMKELCSLNASTNNLTEITNFIVVDETRKLIDASGHFDVFIQLSYLLDFAEDYNIVFVNTKHEIILTRPTNDTNPIQSLFSLPSSERKFLFVKKLKMLSVH